MRLSRPIYRSSPDKRRKKVDASLKSEVQVWAECRVPCGCIWRRRQWQTNRRPDINYPRSHIDQVAHSPPAHDATSPTVARIQYDRGRSRDGTRPRCRSFLGITGSAGSDVSAKHPHRPFARRPASASNIQCSYNGHASFTWTAPMNCGFCC